MPTVTWASKSAFKTRTFYIKVCDNCQEQFFQVPEDCLCPRCQKPGQVGITWPMGLMQPPMVLVANRHGEPCLDFRASNRLKLQGRTNCSLEEFLDMQRQINQEDNSSEKTQGQEVQSQGSND